MRLHPADLAIFGAYLVLVLIVGVLAARRVVSTRRDYFLAGDRLPWWMVGGSIVASNISSHHFVGCMGLAYTIGFAAMTVEWGAILIGFNALLWIFLPHYLRNGFYTMPEFLDRRFGAGARMTYGILVLLTYLFVEISIVLVLGAVTLHELFGLPAAWSIAGLALLTGLYTITGGLRAVVWTEMLQLVVLLVGGIVLSIATLERIGGVGAFLETSHEWKLLLPADDKAFPWTMFLGGVTSISIFYCAANQFIVQRVLAAKDEWHARMGVVLTDWLKLLLPIIIIVPGLMARRLFPNLERSDAAFPTLVRHLLPPGLVGLVLAGLIAAVMSHISGALNSCTTIATVDFWQPWLGKGSSEARAVRFGRIVGVIVLVLGVFWALWLIDYTDEPMFQYLFDAYGYFAPGIATMFLLGVFWKRATHAGALAAGLLTVPLSIVLQRVLPDMAGLNRATIVFWACMAACVAVSLVTRPRPEGEIRHLLWTRDSLRPPPEIRERSTGLRRPLLWWGIVTAIVAWMYIRYGIARL